MKYIFTIDSKGGKNGQTNKERIKGANQKQGAGLQSANKEMGKNRYDNW